MNHKKVSRRLAAILLTAISWLMLCGFTKAATYTGRDFAVNFWSGEMNMPDEDFQQIRQDGFNAIVLVVPWRQFQPDLKSRDMNSDAYAKLARLMNAAEENDLKVVLRVGYTWDCYNSQENVAVRYRKLRSEDSVRRAWISYLKDLYSRVGDHPAFGGAFLTWEDFWNFTFECAAFGAGDMDTPRRCGYSEWVFENYDQTEVSRLYGEEISDPEDVWFPSLTSPARKLVYEWNDAWMNELLADSQEVFPGISMEVRLDIDPVSGTEGVRVGVPHTVTFPAGNAEFTSCMYAAAMGQEFGQEVSADNAVSKAGSILGMLRANAGGKPVFVDQFLYTDNTPGFEMNARVRKDELPDYIVGMAPVLRDMQWGYAVWAYRNYADDVIVNGGFGNRGEGWSFSGSASTREEDGNSRLYLETDSRAVQDFSNRNTSKETGDILSFDYEVLTPCRLRASAGHCVENFALEGKGSITQEMHTFGEHQLALSCLEGAVLIDNVKVYSHVTEGGIYNLDGTPGPYLDAIRTLNANLPD